MKKVILGGIIGAVIIFIWSFAAWTVIPLYTPTMKNAVNEDSLIAVMKLTMDSKKVYVVPGMPSTGPEMTAEQKEAATKEMNRKYAQGPTAMIFYNPKGSDQTMAGRMIIGFIICFVTAALAAWLLVRSTAVAAGYVARVMFFGVLGVFVSMIHLTYWNWMDYPLDYTIAALVDTIVCWILAGLGIAAVVKEKKQAA